MGGFLDRLFLISNFEVCHYCLVSCYDEAMTFSLGGSISNYADQVLGLCKDSKIETVALEISC